MRITRTRQTCRIAVLVLPALLALARPTRADDALPVETLKKIKAATVFLKIENGNEEASGTGFVVYTAGTTAYIATNHHVVNPQEGQPNFGLPRTPAITVVFGSGTPAERSARATVVAAIPRTDLAILKDVGVVRGSAAPRTDLAILKVAGVRDLPRPLDLSQEAPLREKMAVSLFGFPRDGLRDVNNKSPAIIVGKGTVSSLRRNKRGEVATVQIGGDITPGNSGGPVVDGKGRLVGIANVTERDHATGFALPASHLKRLMQGRLLDFALNVRQAGNAGFDIGLELGFFDPLRRLKGVTFFVLPGQKAGVRELAGVPGVRKITLEKRGLNLVGRFTVPRGKGADTPITFQAVYVDGEGTTFLSNPCVRRLEAVARAQRPNPVGGLLLPPPPNPVGGAFLPPPWRRPPKKAMPLDKAALARVFADLESDNFFRRKKALDLLIAAKPQGDRDAVLKAVEPLLKEQDPILFGDALNAHANWSRDKARAAERIAKYLPNFFTRHDAMTALRKIGTPAEKALHPYLEHEDVILTFEVTILLAEIGTKESVAALTRVANGNQQVSHFARRALERIKKRQEQK